MLERIFVWSARNAALALALCLLLIIVGCDDGSPNDGGPTTEEFRQALADELDQAYDVIEFDIEERSNSGAEAYLRIEARFSATLRAREPIYSFRYTGINLRDLEDYNPRALTDSILMLSIMNNTSVPVGTVEIAVGETVEVSSLARANRRGDDWSYFIRIDEDQLPGNYRPYRDIPLENMKSLWDSTRVEYLTDRGFDEWIERVKVRVDHFAQLQSESKRHTDTVTKLRQDQYGWTLGGSVVFEGTINDQPATLTLTFIDGDDPKVTGQLNGQGTFVEYLEGYIAHQAINRPPDTRTLPPLLMAGRPVNHGPFRSMITLNFVGDSLIGQRNALGMSLDDIESLSFDPVLPD